MNSNPQFKERSGAVVVCGERQPALNNWERLSIASGTTHPFARQPLAASGDTLPSIRLGHVL